MTTDDVSKQAHLHTREAAAFSPFLQSIGTGFFFSAALLALLLLWRVQDALRYGVLAFVLVSAASWLFLQWRLIILTTLGRATGLDINQDGVTGKPVQEVERAVKVTIYDEDGNGNVARFKSLERMIALADALVVRNIPLSVKEIVEKEKLMSRGEYDEIMAEMERRGMVAWINPKFPKLGRELTRAGKAVMRDFLRNATTPPQE